MKTFDARLVLLAQEKRLCSRLVVNTDHGLAYANVV